MRYRSEAFMSVPPPKELSVVANPGADTLQDLISRKREAEKNKLRYHLTEADCNLILTNAKDHYYPPGTLIAKAGTPVSAVYRIKVGRVAMMKNGHKLYELSQGHFLGEALFIYGDEHLPDCSGADLVASTPVTLSEVNLPFLRKLLEVDNVLAFKIYRHMCSKISALLFSVLSVVLDSMDPTSPLMKRATGECQLLASQSSSGSLSLSGSGSGSASFSSGSGVSSLSASGSQLSSISKQSSVSSMTSNSSLASSYNSSTSSMGSVDGDDIPISNSGPVPMSSSGSVLSSSGSVSMPGAIPTTCIDAVGLKPIAMAVLTQESTKLRGLKKKLSKSKRLSATFSTVPYKIYTLENNSHGSVTVQVDNKRITVVSASVGFKTKKKIKLSKIMDVARTTNKSVTIIFDMQARTLFFKQPEELTEFCGILLSLLQNTPQSLLKTDTAFPPLPSPTDITAQQKADKEYIQNLSTKQVLHKGDIVVAEGDLYQRIYVVAEGQVNMSSYGRVLFNLSDGDIFGLIHIFHLRPSRICIEVESDTATLLIIPFHRFQDLIATNFPLSVRLHKKAAQLIHQQVLKALQSRDGVVAGFSKDGTLL